ncbi:MAG: hypothetical protein OEY03_01770 [Rhizobacter sp.]|nr:hypothetical protein [Rhizobacter sp.]
MNQAAVGCLLVVMAWQVHAAGPIYRCGSEYSQTPCPGGTVLESSDPRSAEQRAEAKRVAAQDRRRAVALERERRAQEKSIKPALAGGITALPSPAKGAASSAERGKRGAGNKTKKGASTDFTAVEPAKPKPPRAP